MTEPWARCGRCNATLAEHEMDDVETCEEFILRIGAIPASLIPDPLGQSARTVAHDVNGPIQVIPVEDAHRILEDAAREMRAAMEPLERELHEVQQRLLEACDALELWGAFDYELLLLAEEYNVIVGELSPIQLVRRLLVTAYHHGMDDAVPF